MQMIGDFFLIIAMYFDCFGGQSQLTNEYQTALSLNPNYDEARKNLEMAMRSR